ncbi:YoeB-like toxin of type II toxin-antitoxin system [Providencia alcalifaciens]|uniref:YoeB-like toxin of type II toxin-antitoxin system n=1 Tax=Providencia alcalifaciens TaxID=126385 RepID=A0A4R3NG98_9GAMM|nr:type II toxin-antitoxin system YoeB family toxin [Providencia alcalifaciens]TCT31543.1 YoeB-like toxin of type II toxin-antitoxin system [Providencia alcalifaciens]
MSYYNFDDSEQRARYNRNGHIPVPPSAMRKYNEWRRLIANYGYNPRTAAEHVGDTNPERLRGNTFSIRLTQEHRVVYSIQGNNITVHSVGGHYVRQ